MSSRRKIFSSTDNLYLDKVQFTVYVHFTTRFTTLNLSNVLRSISTDEAQQHNNRASLLLMLHQLQDDFILRFLKMLSMLRPSKLFYIVQNSRDRFVVMVSPSTVHHTRVQQYLSNDNIINYSLRQGRFACHQTTTVTDSAIEQIFFGLLI